MASLYNLLDKMVDTINEHTDDINSGGGGTADSVDWEDVQNKPFGVTYGEPLIDNQTFEYDADNAAYLLSENLLLSEGNAYEIIINGTAYTEVADDYMGVAVCIGNPIPFGGADNGKLFCVASMAGTGMMMVLLDGSTSPITITLREGVAKKIDSIYYDTKITLYAENKTGAVHLYHDMGYTKKVTRDEFDIMYNKFPIYVQYGTFPTSASIRPVIATKLVNVESGAYAVYTFKAFLEPDGEYFDVCYTAEYTAPTTTEV